MPATNIYLHKYDRDTFLRQNVGPFGLPIHSWWTFEVRPGVSTSAAKGIAWDGSCVWVSTTSHNASGTPSGLLRLDPSRTAGIGHPPTATVLTSIPLGDDLVDICWNGKGFFGIVYDSSIPYRYLIEIDTAGKVLRTLVNPLPLTARSLAYTDRGIYVSHMIGANVYVNLYDADTGSLINVGNRIFISKSALTPPVTATGLTWDGKDLISKMVDDETAIASLTDIELVDVQPWRFLFVNSNYIRVGGAGFAFERASLAWDGAYIWSLSASLA